MNEIKMLFHNNGIRETMSLQTESNKEKAYKLAQEYIHDWTQKRFNWVRPEKVDTSKWVSGADDPEEIIKIANAWNDEINARFTKSLAALENEPDQEDYAEHAAASCEMANIVIYGCAHIVFFHDEYGCTYMETRITPDSMKLVTDKPEEFCVITLEYH